MQHITETEPEVSMLWEKRVYLPAYYYLNIFARGAGKYLKDSVGRTSNFYPAIIL